MTIQIPEFGLRDKEEANHCEKCGEYVINWIVCERCDGWFCDNCQVDYNQMKLMEGDGEVYIPVRYYVESHDCVPCSPETSCWIKEESK